MLTRQDFDLLLEALTAWESKPAFGDAIETMLGGMLARTTEQREKLLADQGKRRAKAEQERKVSVERSILLKAKLIQLRDEMEANAFLNQQELRTS